MKNMSKILKHSRLTKQGLDTLKQENNVLERVTDHGQDH